MADRTVSVSIRAEVAGYLSGMARVSAATREAASEAENLQRRADAYEKVGAGLLTIGAAAAAAVALAVKSFADFDAQMSQVQSLSHATAAEMDVLRNAALTMGQGIGFSAKQVAEAETELVKAGVSVKDIMGGALKGALDLAAAGQIDVAEATEIAATAMTQFGLAGRDIPHVADLLAAGADKSLGGVEQLGEALKQSGLVAAQFGLSVDDTVGTLAEFAAAGLMGSDAGTSLKQMFLQLATPTKQAQAAMEQYHISAYDAQGDFVGITALAGQLQDGFKGVDSASRDAALGIIFGSDAIRAANILLKDGAKGSREWINSVNDAGFAAEQAAGKTDNLNGDVKKLGAALETGLIKSGSASNDVLRTLVQNVTGMVKVFNDAPGAVQGTALGLTALVAAVGLAGGGFLTLVPKVAAAKAAMVDLNLTGRALAVGLGKGGAIFVAIAALGSAFAALGSQADLTDSQVAKVNASLTAGSSKSLDKLFVGGGGAFDAFGKDAKNAKDALDGLTKGTGPVNVAFGKMFDGLTFGMSHVSDTSKRFEAQFRQLGTVLATTADSDIGAAQKGFSKLLAEMGGGQDTAKRLLDQMEPYKAKLIELAAAQGQTLSSRELLNLAEGKGELAASLAAQSEAKQKEQLQQLQGAAQDASGSIEDLANTITNFGKAQLDVNATQRDFQAAIDEAEQSLKDNGATLDLNTEKGRANSSALDAIASSAEQAAAALYTQTGSQEQATGALQTGRDALVQAAIQYGLTKEQAEAYADQVMGTPTSWATAFSNNAPSEKVKVDGLRDSVLAVPSGKTIQMVAQTAAAQGQIDEFIRRNDGRVISVRQVLIQQAIDAGAAPGVAKAAFASGGAVSGPGTGTSDTAGLYALSNGEHVLTAADVRAMGGQSAVYSFRSNLKSGRKGYAAGGAVYAAPQYAQSFAGQAPVVAAAPVSVSLAGAQMTLMVDGRPMTALVQEQIVSRDRDMSRTSSNGKWKR